MKKEIYKIFIIGLLVDHKNIIYRNPQINKISAIKIFDTKNIIRPKKLDIKYDEHLTLYVRQLV